LFMHHRVSVPTAALIVEHPANLSFIFFAVPPKPMCYGYVRFSILNLLAVFCYVVDEGPVGILIGINRIVAGTARHSVYFGISPTKLNLSVLPRSLLLYLIYRKDKVFAGPTLYRVLSRPAN
jgi:hypothetical protein